MRVGIVLGYVPRADVSVSHVRKLTGDTARGAPPACARGPLGRPAFAISHVDHATDVVFVA